ncbi:uncharacterized protein ACBR49_017777 [Aulostomus maculatus]
MHQTVVKRRDDPLLSIRRCSECCDKFHCSFCKMVFHYLHHIQNHVRNHVGIAVQQDDFVIIKCGLGCRPTPHFHCCYCTSTLIRRADLIKHVAVIHSGQAPPPRRVAPPPRRVAPPPLQAALPQLRASPPPRQAAPPPHQAPQPPSVGGACLRQQVRVTCSHCGVQMNKKNLLVHVRRKHSQEVTEGRADPGPAGDGRPDGEDAGLHRGVHALLTNKGRPPQHAGTGSTSVQSPQRRAMPEERSCVGHLGELVLITAHTKLVMSPGDEVLPSDVRKVIVGEEEQQEWSCRVEQEQPEPPLIKEEQQEWSSRVEQEQPEPPLIKEEQEELWTSQEGEQLQGLEEADISKLPFPPVPVKSEDDEEKPQSSQLHQSPAEESREVEPLSSSSTHHLKTEADG